MNFTEVNQEVSTAIKNNWDEYSRMYEDVCESVTLQSSVNLYSITRAKFAKKVCEVGVGCGLASRLFVTNIMQENAVYVASDISEGMNSIFVKRFEESGILDKKTKLQSLEELDSVDVEKIVLEIGGEVSKKIFSLRVNNEQLPYSNSYFDLYLSSLSMMIVSNHHNQLSEAYRVLEEGGTAGFTVWGRSENSTLFTFVPEVFATAGCPLPKPDRTHFHLSDKDSLIKDVKDAGFKSVKAFYTQTNPNLGSVDDVYYFCFNAPNFKPHLSTLTEEQREKVKEVFYEKYEESYGDETSKFMTWEILIVVAKK